MQKKQDSPENITVPKFDNGYWSAIEFKGFAQKTNVQEVGQVSKRSIAKAI